MVKLRSVAIGYCRVMLVFGILALAVTIATAQNIIPPQNLNGTIPQRNQLRGPPLAQRAADIPVNVQFTVQTSTKTVTTVINLPGGGSITTQNLVPVFTNTLLGPTLE